MAAPDPPPRAGLPPAGTPRTLSHFALLRFTGAYWGLDAAERRRQHRALRDGVSRVADAAHLYQMFPMSAAADVLLWTALETAEPDRVRRYFSDLAGVLAPLRPWLAVELALWGFTRPSTYTRTRSSQEMDPFGTRRKPYLVLYPFVKTSAWYALSRDTRQGMMNGHIRVGKEYPDVDQLLLYSVGLQDQEFVVVYETDDLPRFSDLVNRLRSTEARAYTERDTPLYTALHHPHGGALELFA